LACEIVVTIDKRKRPPAQPRRSVVRPPRFAVRYRLLGHERVALSQQQLEALIHAGLIGINTKVMREGESFATALSARAEFQHLLGGDDTKAQKPS
jgi:hypothetical protein